MPCGKQNIRLELFAEDPNKFIAPNSPAALDLFRKIEWIYTDLDGTMLAPGGRVLVNHDNKPSVALPEAINALKSVGVKIVLASGRRVEQLSEIMRLFELDGYIAEMGAIRGGGVGTDAFEEYTFDASMIPSGMTPHDYIIKMGALDALFAAYPGYIEFHTPWHTNRRIGALLRGRVDLAEANALLSEFPFDIELMDNGIVKPTEHGLAFEGEIHAYHLMPKGITKNYGVAYDIKMRGIDPATSLSLGDAPADVLMGEATAGYVCSINGLKNPACIDALRAREAATIIPECCTVNGWVEVANAIVAAKQS